MNNKSDKQKVVIVGAGFAGIRCALDLAGKKLYDVEITLINDNFHFEYHPSLYRVVTGRSPLEVCIAIPDIIKGTDIKFIEDRITSINLRSKTLCGESACDYTYDYLVLALGSETTYFDVPGLKEHSFGFKSIHEALVLKRHLHETFSTCRSLNETNQECATHIVIVGAGASGVELAGELITYTKDLALHYKLPKDKIKIDLIERSQRVLPFLPESVSKLAQEKLESMGVTVLLNKEVMKEDIENIYLKDMKMKTKTVIWTAGVRANRLYQETNDIHVNSKGKVEVDPHLRPVGVCNVFVLGDGANTKYSGMATTAIHDGKFTAKNIENSILNRELISYEEKTPPYVIPVGFGWAIANLGRNNRSDPDFVGFVGWCLRRVADFRFFLTILPFSKALLAFFEGTKLSQTCPSCEPEHVRTIF